MNGNGETLKYRVAQLEECSKELDAKVDAILTNHLPHIHETLIKLETRVTIIGSLNLLAILIAIALQAFF